MNFKLFLENYNEPIKWIREFMGTKDFSILNVWSDYLEEQGEVDIAGMLRRIVKPAVYSKVSEDDHKNLHDFYKMLPIIKPNYTHRSGDLDTIERAGGGAWALWVNFPVKFGEKIYYSWGGQNPMYIEFYEYTNNNRLANINDISNMENRAAGLMATALMTLNSNQDIEYYDEILFKHINRDDVPDGIIAWDFHKMITRLRFRKL